jgi:protein-arginine kinase activator protein McsA
MCENICNIQKNSLATYKMKTLLQHKTETDETFWNILLQHPDQNACNICLETDETFSKKRLQRASETLATSSGQLLQHPYETIATYL